VSDSCFIIVVAGLHPSFIQFHNSYSICQGMQFSLLCPRESNTHHRPVRKTV